MVATHASGSRAASGRRPTHKPPRAATAAAHSFLNLQQSKELLVDFNELSAAHAEAHRQALQRSAASLKAVVEDLHDVFRRVRALRRRLREALPHEVALQAEFKGAAADDE